MCAVSVPVTDGSAPPSPRTSTSPLPERVTAAPGAIELDSTWSVPPATTTEAEPTMKRAPTIVLLEGPEQPEKPAAVHTVSWVAATASLHTRTDGEETKSASPLPGSGAKLL